MSQDISLFPRYSTKENRATNYTLLVLRLIYEESPRLYQQFLDVLLGEAAPATLPAFKQQQKKKGSTPDGEITQPSYALFVETKMGEWFYDQQLRNHLSALSDVTATIRILIALSPFEYGGESALMLQYSAEAERYPGVQFVALSFRRILDCLPVLDARSHLGRIIEEFETYLGAENLLGSWQTQLDVVNTAKWPEHVSEHHVYTCPATGGAYAHRRCRFLGAYQNKCVSHVAEIRGVVRLELNGKAEVLWRNDNSDNTELVDLARVRVRAAWGATRFHDENRLAFILAEAHPTTFNKDTPGPMWGSRQYFDLTKLAGGAPSSAGELAQKLAGRSWSELA